MALQHYYCLLEMHWQDNGVVFATRAHNGIVISKRTASSPFSVLDCRFLLSRSLSACEHMAHSNSDH